MSEGAQRRLPSLTLVLPAHNEAENLRWLIPHAAEVLPDLAERYEVVLVDDGSTDGSGDVARAAAAEHGLDLRVIRHQRKSGYGITVADGLRAARMEWVGFTDADGQFELRDFERLVRLAGDHDLVGGYRLTREDHRMRTVVAGVYRTAVRTLYGLRVRDTDCAMKLMRKSFLDSIVIENRSAVMNAELYIKAKRNGLRIVQVGVPHHPRVAGVRSGARPRAIARAIKELVLWRIKLARKGPAQPGA